MSEPVLSARALNRAMLARQLLLERANIAIPAALEAVGGLQTQYAPTGYVGLWSRLVGFRRVALTEALESRQVIQGTMMRSTIHMASAADYPLIVAGTGPARRAWWARTRKAELASVDIGAVTDRVRALLADGPRRAADLQAELESEGHPRIAWAWAAQWLDLVRVPPSGTWEHRRADLYALAEMWLPTGLPPTEADGLAHLVRRHLGGFGPAAPADIANWAGASVTAIRPGLDALDLARYRDDRGRILVDLRGAPLPDPSAPAPVRFLHTWEASLLAHARRTEILPERHRSRVFSTKTPQSVPTFLVDGVVSGSWRHEAGRIITIPFEPLDAATRRAVDDEAEALAAFHAD